MFAEKEIQAIFSVLVGSLNVLCGNALTPGASAAGHAINEVKMDKALKTEVIRSFAKSEKDTGS
ncbi:MAG: hypothetical protein PHV59_06700, partial [Victivallales bacterium]|nr:hypothetical protein [Victivallales bacterium]